MNLSCRSYQEKREFLRMRLEVPIEVSFNEQPAKTVMCHNLSGGGLLISTDQAAQVGAPAQVTVRSGYGHSPELHAQTCVQRVDEQTADGVQRWKVALKIVRLIE